MKYIVVGCGRVGSELANRLHAAGHEVCVVDPEATAFANLGPGFRGRTIQGEVLNQHVLRRAGIETADGVAAVTNSDSLNAVVAHAARVIFRVPNVVARNYDPRRRAVFEAFGLQVISSTSWGAQRMEELLHHGELLSVFSAGNGEVEVYEVTIPAAWAGRRLGDLTREGVCGVAHTRAGRASLPEAELRLEEGDIVDVSATLEGMEWLRARLAAGDR
ncbi:MAG TPA: TrkA family potassium uptake protein [Anaerolineales bacterium]|nr:TrkA family potassium uptake protein [Anaerolineales bacterium]